MKNFWEDPAIQELNRLPMRSPLIPFSSPEDACSECAAGPEVSDFTHSGYAKSLNGIWKFRLIDAPDNDKKDPELFDWTSSTYEYAKKWSDIMVPGTWTLQGYDKPHYTNIQMPFDTLPPNVPRKNPTGLYRLEIKIPSEWKGRRIVLHIGSAESCVQIFINGSEVGISKDTRLPCEFDITPYLKRSDGLCSAVIALKVIRYSDASFVEDQDQWWFGGIHRSVYLYSTEQTYIQDIEALTRIENKNGIIPLAVTLGYTDTEHTETRCTNMQMDNLLRIIKYSVYSLEGTPKKGIPGKLEASGEIRGCFDYRKTQNQIRTDITIKNADLWSSENPKLYILTVSLYEPDTEENAGRHIESVSCTVGFKSVRVEKRELLINNRKVYIHGVNRHEHNEFHGKTLSTEQMIRDIILLKQYNFNAVRTCHYPDDERWYELCDRYGIYLMDEANIENHAYYDCLARSDEWTYAYMQRVQRMVRRDKNHASIFCWSLGNESGDGQNQVACQAWIRRIDSTRIVHYEGFIRPERTQGAFTLDSLGRGKGLTDLISPMYPSINLIVDYAEKCDDYRPIIMCEYSHAMGNANGSLADYWHAIESHHGLQGGFIWDWIDQGIAAETPAGDPGQPQGGKYWKYGGDFGDTPTDYDFCLNGLLFPDQTPKPAMEECRKLFSPIRLYEIHAPQGIFEIENRYDFTSLDTLSLKWSITKNGITVDSGIKLLPQIGPGDRSRITISEIPERLRSADGAEFIFHADYMYAKDTPWAKKGDICGSDEYILKPLQEWQTFASPSVLTEQTIRNFAESFQPQLFHALTENECIKRELPHLNEKKVPFCFLNKPTVEWIQADLANISVSQVTDNVFELYTGSSLPKREKIGTMVKNISSCSMQNNRQFVELDIVLTLSDTITEYPRAGIFASLPADYTTVTWYGRGPQECYSDRKDGALVGLYTRNIADLEVPYIVPQENGTRCDVRYVEIKGKKETLHILSVTPFSFSILPYTAQDMFVQDHRAELTNLSTGNNGHWILSIDAAHRGVGTGACGPDTLEQYKVRPGTYFLNLKIW